MKRWLLKVMWMAAVVTDAADAPYLPAVGPAPLRFARPPVVKPATTQLPPLITVEPRPAPAATPEVVPPVTPVTPVAPPPDPASADPVVPGIEPPPVQVPYDPVVSNGVEIARPDTENLTPQMFMKYFTGRPGTNASGMTIIAPMPFVPPAPPAPSSTATFQTTPPAKP